MCHHVVDGAQWDAVDCRRRPLGQFGQCSSTARHCGGRTVGKGSNARIDQLRAVDKARIGDSLAKLIDTEMLETEQAIVTILGL
jgi:hypothetical protein